MIRTSPRSTWLFLLAVMLVPAARTLSSEPRPTAGDAQELDVRAEFVRLHGAGDADALRVLWRAHPDAILVAIDEDLEAGLAAWEADPAAAEDTTREAFARALWGAEQASAATGRAIFLDYAASFVGWDAAQRKSFREGQAAFGRARQALAAGDHAAAAEAGRQCTALALPLGDWWGSAMGLSVEAAALLRQQDAEGSLVAASRARLLYQQLGLVGAERGVLETQVEALVELRRWPRALAGVDAALALAQAAGDEQALGRLGAQRQRIVASREAR